MSEITNKEVGAGGFWKVINEKKDASVVKQITPLSCVAAVGVMLLDNRGISMTQREIIDIIGEASTTEKLADFLNEVDKPFGKEKWHGVIIAIKHLEKIAKKRPFGAIFREGNPLGHLVFIEKIESNILYVKDSWEGTAYQMTVEELSKVWNGEIIFRWNLSK